MNRDTWMYMAWVGLALLGAGAPRLNGQGTSPPALPAPPASPAATAPERSERQAMEAAIGPVRLDGSLRLVYAVKTPRTLRDLGITLQLLHEVETDVEGNARSHWCFVGLHSVLVPEGRETLLWRRADGGVSRFDLGMIERFLTEAGDPTWQIRTAGEGRHELRTADGRSWTFVGGLPVAAEHPAWGRVKFETLGGWIKAVVPESKEGEPWLAVSYDAAAQPRDIRLPDGEVMRCEWNDRGQLVRWEQADGVEIRFTYRDGLLAEIIAEGESKTLSWRKNPGWGRGDARWAGPVHLAAFDGATFTYALTRRGFRLTYRPSGAEEEVVTLFNPRLKQVVQTRKGDTALARFQASDGGGIRLESITGPDGRVLERHVYGDGGRLVGIERADASGQRLVYDALGRMIAVEAVPQGGAESSTP